MMHNFFNPVISYLLEASLLWLLLTVAYLPLMRWRSWLLVHRVYLLAIPLVSLGFPLLGIWPDQALPSAVSWELPPSLIIPLPEATVPSIAWEKWVLAGYVATALGMTGWRLARWGQLWGQIRNWPQHPSLGKNVRCAPVGWAVGSYFSYVLWPANRVVDATDSALLLAHEQAHVTMCHSWDRLGYHLLGAWLWFHPAYHLCYRELALIHELQADRRAVRGAGKGVYLRLMVQEALGQQANLAHPFGRSFLTVRAKAMSRPRKALPSAYVGCVLLAVGGLAVSPRLLATQRGLPTMTEVVAVDKAPVPLNFGEIQRQIGYPVAARENEIEGTVVVRILVGRDGRYLRHEDVHVDHPALAEAVAAHVSDLRFSPPEKDGRAVSFWVNVPFRFRLVP